LAEQYGLIAVLGSGETSLAGGRVFESIAARLEKPVRIAILETPAGFELNSAQVAGRVGEFLKARLKNFNPIVDIISARKRGTPFDPDDAGLLAPLAAANLIFMGPGSPTYAVRQLKDSLAWDLVQARHRQGAALVFASAATIAIGACALPVYEIYKVGEDVRVVPGLDLFADFGLPLSFIPHWNNTDGGEDVDTSRCFVGMERFAQWCAQLPAGHTTVGLDEHTGLIIDLQGGKCLVSGVSSVSLLRECDPMIYPARAEFPLAELGQVRWPKRPGQGISARALEMTGGPAADPGPQTVPDEVARLAVERREARLRKDWAASDLLRRQLAALGWQVQDTPDDQVLTRSSE
jgi:cyanophycinase-like exopeptidase